MNDVRNLKSNPQKRLQFKRWRTIFAVYIVLLGISYWVRLSFPVPIHVPTDQKNVTLTPANNSDNLQPNINIAYLDSDPDAIGNKPVILLLHGNPMAVRKTFQNLIQE